MAIGVVLVILYVSEYVEQLLVVILSEFYLLTKVVLNVAISAALSRLVGLIFLCSHCHDVLDTFIDYCTL